jgi:hypothetical protein
MDYLGEHPVHMRACVAARVARELLVRLGLECYQQVDGSDEWKTERVHAELKAMIAGVSNAAAEAHLIELLKHLPTDIAARTALFVANCERLTRLNQLN